MPLSKKLTKALDAARVKYDTLKHRVVYTAFDLAATLHVPLTQVVKTLLIKTDKGLAVALLSAASQLDSKKLGKVASVKKVSIPTEREMVKKIKVSKGPLSSFGSLYKLPVFLDRKLLKQKRLVLSGGSFKESVLVHVKDFLRFENPIVGVFGVPKKQIKKKNRRARRKS
ncbi:YbaK/EbsC family protein [Candidatus Uhrbacteria bacterium]|nr:YbaK/EbsC family protein [Candidatus Uhrbacteria bacterium]